MFWKYDWCLDNSEIKKDCEKGHLRFVSVEPFEPRAHLELLQGYYNEIRAFVERLRINVSSMQVMDNKYQKYAEKLNIG